MSTLRRIATNVSVLSVSQSVLLVGSLISNAYLARVLGPSGFGQIGFGTALLSFISLFVRLGFDDLGARLVAVSSESFSVRRLVRYILGIRLSLVLGAYALYAALTFVFVPAPSFRLVLLIQGLQLLLLALSVEWVFLGLEQVRVIAVRTLIVTLLNVTGLFLFVRSASDIWIAVTIQISAMFGGVIWLSTSFVRVYGWVRPGFDSQQVYSLLKQALPLTASHFMITIYYSADKLMLGLMYSTHEVGLYDVAYKVLYVATAPATVLYQSFLPSLSQSHGDLESMRHRARSFAHVMLLCGFPIAFGAYLFAPEALLIMGGEAYSEAAPALYILTANVAFIYLNMAHAQPLIAWGHQQSYMYAIFAGATTNIVMNLILIPRYGLIGAATATLLSEIAAGIAVFGIHFSIVRQHYFTWMGRVLLAISVGMLLPWWVSTQLGLPSGAQLLVIALSYLVSCFLLSLLPPHLLKRLLQVNKL